MRILGVGIATLDIINTVSSYPDEDTEVRALSQRRARGGNTANTLTVLTQLGHACSWAGVLPSEPDTVEIEQSLVSSGIDLTLLRRLDSGKLPTSYITLNAANGSRTIVHYRDLPEYRADWFDSIDLVPFDWVHFEGREMPELQRMMHKSVSVGKRISLEVEKPRDGIEQLFGMPEILLFSRDYAVSCGYDAAENFLRETACEIGSQRPDLFCTWGEAGAWALTRANMLYHQPVFDVSAVVDTIGAGDVFNAGVIDTMVRSGTLQEAIEYAGRLAALKCGCLGLDSLPLDEINS